MTATGVVLGAYLLGSVPFAYVAVRALSGVDIRTVGSGNAGATNVLRTAGPLPALVVLLFDVGKGVLPVWAARVLGAPDWAVAAAGLAAVVGHLFPLYIGFRGGKGMATAAGVMAYLAPLPVLAAAALFAACVAVTRWVSLGSVVAVTAVPLLILLFRWRGWGEPAGLPVVLTAVAIAVLVVGSHASNLRRLAAGREARIDMALRSRERSP